MSVRTVDTAQFKRREDEFDYDVLSDGFGQSLSPGNEQRDFWGSKAADTNLPANLITVCGSATTGCHGRIESDPLRAATTGFRLPQGADPSSSPVQTYRGKALLSNDGMLALVAQATREDA